VPNAFAWRIRTVMTNYELLEKQVTELLKTEPFYAASMSNISSLIMEALPDLNWAGFYIFRNSCLTVGPFQGKPACIHIEVGKGVCGTAALLDTVQLVPDVHLFKGHIACDSASRSEIVVPLHKNGQVAGVIDIDSPYLARFTEHDKAGLEKLAALLENTIFNS
jgi:GAF domain-containing protein